MAEWGWACPVDEYARDMQRQIAVRLDAIGEWAEVKTHDGARLLARHSWWAARQSANPRQHLSSAKGLYAMARDMETRPDEYKFPRRAVGQSCWLRFKELQNG